MIKTEHYALNKPEYNDIADIYPAVCENMDTIDLELFKKLDKTDLAKLNNYGVTKGTLTSYTVTLDPAPTAYVDGMEIIILPHTACGDNPTLNVNGLGSLQLKNSNGDNLLAGDLKVNIPAGFVRVGNCFFMRSSDDYARKAWASVIGSPLVYTNSVPTLKDKTQTIKNTIAANIVSKGVPANGTDTLNALADDISKITIKTLGGYKLISGIATIAYFEPTSVPYVSPVYAAYLSIPELAEYSKIMMFKANGIFSYKGYNGNDRVIGTGKTASCVHVNGLIGTMYGHTPNIGIQQGNALACQSELNGAGRGDNWAYNFDINKIYVYRGIIGLNNGTCNMDNTTYDTNIQWYAVVQ